MVGLREDKANLTAEQTILRQRVNELETALNNERSKRLRDMHENEVLRRNNSVIEAKLQDAEKEMLQSNTVLLGKIQKYETASLLNESKARVIQTQAEELNDLTRKLSHAKAEERALHQQMMSLQDRLNSTLDENESLHKELSRLRRDVVELSVKQSDKSRAFGLRPGSRAAASSSSRSSLLKTTSASIGISSGLSALHFTDDSFDETSDFVESRPSTASFSSLPYEYEKEVSVSPLSSAQRPHVPVLRRAQSTSSMTPTALSPSLSKERGGGAVAGAVSATRSAFDSSNASTDFLPPLEASAITSSAAAAAPDDKQRAQTAIASRHTSNKQKKATDQSIKSKTTYVGSGLGFKQEITFSPKGSAKMMLKKIMDDFNSDT